MICKNLEIIDCLIPVKMNSIVWKEQSNGECLRHLAWFTIMVVNFFELEIELIDIKLNVIELNVIELIVIELIDTE